MKQYLTQEKYNEVKAKLADFKTNGRREVSLRLKQAKELGDLSENADYQEAREQQNILERRIQELEEVLRSSEIIEKGDGGSSGVKVGSKVSLKKGDKEVVYTIVGSHEAHPAEGLISNESPIGRALLGKKVGDSVSVETLKGSVEYEILSIE